MLQIRKGFLALVILACGSINAMQLVHRNNDFFVEDNNTSTKIERAFMDKELRGIDAVKLNQLATAGAYLKLNKLEDGKDYTLRLGARLNGGGVGGATVGFWIGKIAVHGTAQVLMQIAAICTGPAYPVTLATLQAVTLAPVEAASNAVGLGCGIIGATITGPV